MPLHCMDNAFAFSTKAHPRSLGDLEGPVVTGPLQPCRGEPTSPL